MRHTGDSELEMTHQCSISVSGWFSEITKKLITESIKYLYIDKYQKTD